MQVSGTYIDIFMSHVQIIQTYLYLSRYFDRKHILIYSNNLGNSYRGDE